MNPVLNTRPDLIRLINMVGRLTKENLKLRLDLMAFCVCKKWTGTYNIISTELRDCNKEPGQKKPFQKGHKNTTC